jgi:FKBP-type peptidyl-prolyl cis-trans isomerase 2
MISLGSSEIMKRFLIFILAGVILFSGCVGQRSVKIGDNVSVDYVGRLENGTVFDTSIESVAMANNITRAEYKPLNFTVGKGGVIKGFDEGVVGMKVGESRTLTLTPDKAYGPINPGLIQAIPILYNESANVTFPKVFEVPKSQFEQIFGTGHKTGDSVKYPGRNFNLTVLNIGDNVNVSLSYNLSVGNEVVTEGAPWNETVIKVDDKNITVRHDVKKNSTVQFQGAPWNTTVIAVSNENITLRHNPIPDSQIRTMFGAVRVSFNKTSVIMDRNPELAGKTLIFNVTLVSINK